MVCHVREMHRLLRTEWCPWKSYRSNIILVTVADLVGTRLRLMNRIRVTETVRSPESPPPPSFGAEQRTKWRGVFRSGGIAEATEVREGVA